MSFPTKQVGEITDIYEIVGTSGTYTASDGDSDIPEMTKTLSCKAGDKLIVSFDGSFLLSGGKWCNFNIEVGGVEVGNKEYIYQSAGVAGTLYRPASITRAYEIPSDGDYTIKARIYSASGSPQLFSNYRTMTVQHINS